MNTNDLIQRWSTFSLQEIEDQIRRGEDLDSIIQLLGAETVSEIQQISSTPPSFGPREEVVLLPGIMGSMLVSIRGVTTLLWVNPLLFIQGNARYLRLSPDADSDEYSQVDCVPLSLEKLTYFKISLSLNRNTVLHEFPYDWRRPIEYNADILHKAIERWSEGDPERKFNLVAHSMGGLVSRAYLARHQTSAEKRIRRLVLHGTPNFGSPNAVETLYNGNSMMGTVDRLNSQNAMREVVFSLPSIYQLLPAPREYYSANRPYPVDFDMYNADAWSLPGIRQVFLDGAYKLHKELGRSDPQVPIDMIAGCHIQTLVTAGLEIGSGKASFTGNRIDEGSDSGDGTVPLWSAHLPGANMYFIQDVHRRLPGNTKVIQATMDLIQSGRCSLPQSLPVPKRGLFSFEPTMPAEIRADNLKSKIETGTASSVDINQLYFAF